MAKKDRQEDDEIETQTEQPKENAMAKKDDEPAPVGASTEGLVKMTRDGGFIHAHPTTVHDHKKNGWKHV